MPRVLSPEDVEDFRRRLCVAAEGLFAERGIAAVTMRELAQALGVSAMTPYRYFRDKDAILAAVRAAAFNRFATALETANAGPGDAVERSRRTGQAYVDFALAEPQAYRLMFDLSQPTEGDYPELQAALARARRTLTAHVEALIEAGLLHGDAELMGHMFWAGLHGVLMLRLADQLSPSIDPDRLQTALIAALTRGLVGAPA